ncbi:MAG: iron-containing alcohol dehydrogenase family protein [Armatimonadota bacterium]
MRNAINQITSPQIVHYGEGAFSVIADETARLGTRAVVVTGGRLHQSELIKSFLGDLCSRNVNAFLSDPVVSEPTVDMVDELASVVRRHCADVVVAVGGGSVMDCAKAAAVMAVHDGPTEDYQLKRREITNPPIAQVFAPTTAGTGSEATRVSVLTNPRVGVKRSISHSLMTPDVVVLDPELVVTCPLHLTTTTAMDAFSHAIESAVSTKANVYTRQMALAAIEKLSVGLPRSQKDLNDLDARLDCLLGACFAGMAMQQGMGASHSLAPAICIFADVRHSEAVAALLPHSIRLNQELVPGVYDEVAHAMRVSDVATALEEMCAAGGFTCSLSSLGIGASDWPAVREIMLRYASHRQTNPVDVSDEYAEMLFMRAI